MKSVVIDLRKISDPYSGLGQFSLSLGESLYRLNTELNLLFLIPDNGSTLWEGASFINISELPRFQKEIGLLHHLHQESQLWLKGCRNLLTVHDMNFIYKYYFIRRNYKKFKFGNYLRRFDLVTCISNFTKHELNRFYSNRYSEAPVIYNGLNGLSAPEKPDFIPNRPFFFSIGAFLRKKNLHALIPAMQHLRDYQWLIAGHDKGSYADFLKAQVKHLGLTSDILFTGALSESHKSWYYQHCEALFFPSVSEGFGLPVLEAYSVGKPVFCFPLTSLPEVTGGQAYFLEASGSDKMASFIINSMKTESMKRSDERKAYAAKFSWDNAALSYLDLYRSLLTV